MSGYRNPFTVEEERKILHYIFRKNGFYKLRGLQFWKELERDELPTRTYWSLHERFRKHIINNVQNPAYGLSFEEQVKLKRIYGDTAKEKKCSTKPAPAPLCNPNIRTEAQGNLARNFFELSDSDDSDEGENSTNVERKSKPCRFKGRIGSNSNNTTRLMEEEMNSAQEENSLSTGNLGGSVIEIDTSGSSSDSEVFSVQDQINFNAVDRS